MMPQHSGGLEDSKFFHQTYFWFFPLRQKLGYTCPNISHGLTTYTLFSTG